MPEAGVPKGLAVWTDDPEDMDSLKLASRLGVPFHRGEDPPAADWLLFLEEGVLFLHSAAHEEFKPLYVDYLEGDFAKRWRSASRNDLLAKAVGLKKGTRSICDATCGLGYDAFFLATFPDVSVTTCERNPIAAELVMNALLRVKEEGRFEDFPLFFHWGDGRDFLRASKAGSFDAVYLDPMYPREAEKSAKQKKEMQLFRELVGADLDAKELFTAAWNAAKNRVVVKRPDDAEALDCGREPDIVFDGKTVRYDVYLKTN
jgi:16S rRNA (guanine1516-N2)-methyltransferase